VSFVAHRDTARLERAIARAGPVRLTAVAYRFTTPAYATRADLVTGEGARRYGGRWNPPGSFAAVYASLSPETALAETLAMARRYGLLDATVTPRVLAALRIDRARILDLTDGATRQRLGVSAARMVGEPWPAHNQRGREALTQAIGRVAHEAGLAGLRVPSAADPRGENVVLFPDRVAEAGSLAIVHAEALPARHPH
jgi:RES domain-containing protein